MIRGPGLVSVEEEGRGLRKVSDGGHHGDWVHVSLCSYMGQWNTNPEPKGTLPRTQRTFRDPHTEPDADKDPRTNTDRTLRPGRAPTKSLQKPLRKNHRTSQTLDPGHI